MQNEGRNWPAKPIDGPADWSKNSDQQNPLKEAPGEVLEVIDVSRRFGDFVALDQVSLEINAGEFFTLLGPSGCGKTTLLRMIAGFDQPDNGDIRLDGQSLLALPPEKRPIHTVFQSYALFPHMTVAQNIGFPLRMAKLSQKEIDYRVAEVLDDVRLPDKARHYPDELSGGQKQRIAIARALVNRPRLLLLDEPLSALDAKLKEQMQIELINLQKEVGITFVYVTHDQGEALALSHRIAVMNQGQISQVDVHQVKEWLDGNEATILDIAASPEDPHRQRLEDGSGPRKAAAGGTGEERKSPGLSLLPHHPQIDDCRK